MTRGDIFGQLVNADGSLAGDNIPISTLPAGEFDPSVAYASATNQYPTVWAGQPAGNDVFVFARLFAADASPLGAAFQVSTAATANLRTDLALNPVTNTDASLRWVAANTVAGGPAR